MKLYRLSCTADQGDPQASHLAAVKVRNLNKLKEFQKFFFLILGSDCLVFLYLYCNNFKSMPLENKCSKAYYQSNFSCPIYISQISVQAIKDFHILWIQLKFKYLPHR